MVDKTLNRTTRTRGGLVCSGR